MFGAGPGVNVLPVMLSHYSPLKTLPRRFSETGIVLYRNQRSFRFRLDRDHNPILRVNDRHPTITGESSSLSLCHADVNRPLASGLTFRAFLRLKRVGGRCSQNRAEVKLELDAVSSESDDAEKDADDRLSWAQGWRKPREHDYDESEG